MDQLTLDKEFEVDVLQAMRDFGIGREEAILVVSLNRGYVYGAGDLVSVRPISAERRRALGIDHDPRSILARDLAEVAEHKTTEAHASPDDAEVSGTSAAGRRA
jgi:hypothetical protein